MPIATDSSPLLAESFESFSRSANPPTRGYDLYTPRRTLSAEEEAALLRAQDYITPLIRGVRAGAGRILDSNRPSDVVEAFFAGVESTLREREARARAAIAASANRGGEGVDASDSMQTGRFDP